MKKLITILVMLSFSIITFCQEFDTIPLRSIFIDNFCLGDNINKLKDVFGKPSDIKYNIKDNAIENSEPSKNIYYFGENYFSEPFEISTGKIGEFNINTKDYDMTLMLLINNDTLTFRIGDKLNLKSLKKRLPYSANSSQYFYSEDKKKKGYAYVTLKISHQNEFFKYPYSLINTLNITYKDSCLSSFTTYYYKE